MQRSQEVQASIVNRGIVAGDTTDSRKVSCLLTAWIDAPGMSRHLVDAASACEICVRRHAYSAAAALISGFTGIIQNGPANNRFFLKQGQLHAPGRQVPVAAVHPLIPAPMIAYFPIDFLLRLKSSDIVSDAMCNFFIEEPTPYPSQEGNMDVFGDQFPSWEG